MIIEALDELNMIDDNIEEPSEKQPLEEGLFTNVKLKKLIADPNVQKLIREGAWETVYRRVPQNERIDLTNVLLKANINPLLKGKISDYGMRVPAFPVITAGFFNGSDLMELNIVKGIEEIKNNAFSNCKKLKLVKFDDNCDVSLDGGVFNGCSSLGQVTINSSSKIYYNGAAGLFGGCSSLKTIKVLGHISDLKKNTNLTSDLAWLKGAPEGLMIEFTFETEQHKKKFNVRRFMDEIGSTSY